MHFYYLFCQKNIIELDTGSDPGMILQLFLFICFFSLFLLMFFTAKGIERKKKRFDVHSPSETPLCHRTCMLICSNCSYACQMGCFSSRTTAAPPPGRGLLNTFVAR